MNTENSHNGIEEFERMYSSLKEAYIFGGLSYHAIKIGQRLEILHARVFLDVKPTASDRKSVIFLDQEVGYLPGSDIGLDVVELIEHLFSGQSIDTPHGQLVFSVDPGSVRQSIFRPLHELALPHARLSVLTLSGAAMPIFRFSTDADWTLGSNNPPYDSMVELLTEFRLAGYSGNVSCVEVHAVNVGEIDFRSSVSGQVAEPGVFLPPTADKSSLNIAVIVYHQGLVIKRLVLAGDQLSWTELETSVIPGIQYGKGVVEIPVGAGIKCFAVYKGIVQHVGWIGDQSLSPNWRRMAYDWADSQCEVLRDLLFEESRVRRESRDFEVGVASLLWMMGFGVLQLRAARLHNNPDLLATTPGGRMVLVECTTDVIDKEDKLAKLHSRAKSMIEKLASSGASHIELMPVLVTSLPAIEVMDIDKASKFGILVLTKDDLKVALDRTFFPHEADAIFQEQIQLLHARQGALREGSTLG